MVYYLGYILQFAIHHKWVAIILISVIAAEGMFLTQKRILKLGCSDIIFQSVISLEREVDFKYLCINLITCSFEKTSESLNLISDPSDNDRSYEFYLQGISQDCNYLFSLF